MFEGCKNLNLSFTILTNNITYINKTFLNAATEPGSQITINYTSENENIIDQLISTKSANSNVVKGTKLTDYNIQLSDSTVNLNSTTGFKGKNILLTSTESDKVITSFELDGVVIQGNEFIMPDHDITITNITKTDGAESSHMPYENNIDTTYFEKTYTGATSITVDLTYQTESTWNDWIYLYKSPTTIYQNKKYGGTPLTTETITIPGNYIKITFKTSSSGNDYYGFKAVIIPNYD